MGVMADRASVERILFAVFTHENHKEGVAVPFLVGNCAVAVPTPRVRGRAGG